MKVLMGVTVCFLELPVLAWLCYRCLEREQEVWRKGKWFLTLMLLIYGGASGYRYWQGKETALELNAALGLLVWAVFLFINLMWAREGLRSFGAGCVFCAVFLLMFRGLPELLEYTPFAERQEIFLACSIGALVLSVLFLGLILMKGWYWKIPGRVQVVLALAASGFWLGDCFVKAFLAGEKDHTLLVFVMLALVLGFGAVSLFCFEKNRKREMFYLHRQEQLFEDYSTVLYRYYTVVSQSEDAGRNLLEHCSNRMVNAALFWKLKECREKKIRVKLDLTQFEGGYVENTDWLKLFSGLFDHAIEECAGLERGKERFIRVRSRCAGGFEVIVFLHSRNKERKGKAFEKELALHSLEEIVQKYGGTFLTKEEENTFQTTVSIRIQEKR